MVANKRNRTNWQQQQAHCQLEPANPPHPYIRTSHQAHAMHNDAAAAAATVRAAMT